MQTQCPECQTTFNITQQHLDVADGQVRCTQCQTVFDGYISIQDSDKPEPPQLDDIADMADHKVDAEPQPPHAANSLIYSELLEDNNKPGFGKAFIRVLFTLLSIALLAALLLQTTYLKRSELVENPAIAPYIYQACDAIELCTIPVKRDLEQFQLESRHVYAHPNIAKALVVAAVFRNNASFTQPYPTLVLSMSNVRGQEVATRRFSPAEYLDKFSDASAGIAARQSSSISLELSDPGEQAMAFEIDFQ